MPHFAVISGNLVINVVVGDDQATVESVVNAPCIDITENPAGIGWTFDEATGTFIRPEVPAE